MQNYNNCYNINRFLCNYITGYYIVSVKFSILCIVHAILFAEHLKDNQPKDWSGRINQMVLSEFALFETERPLRNQLKIDEFLFTKMMLKDLVTKKGVNITLEY